MGVLAIGSFELFDFKGIFYPIYFEVQSKKAFYSDTFT